MTIYVALLRGINVGGHNMIKMPELKRMLEGMGLERVQTYIQSGNALFVSDKEAEPLQKAIEDEIKMVFGLSVAVVLRTSTELKGVLDSCTFAMDSLAKGESIHVSFMRESPSAEALSRLRDLTCEPDEFQIRDKEIYVLFRQSVRDSKLPSKLQKLGVPATSRNWNTIVELIAMVEALGTSAE